MLIVTIHDVAPPTLAAVRALRDRAAAWGASAVTLLAVPDYHRVAPLAACPDTVAWLRARGRAGDEIALHGLAHRQDAPIARWRDRVRARLFTAGEGEMLGTGAAAPAPLAAARRALATLVEAPIDGFVAPAWLEPADLATTLAALGFGWHETALRLTSLRDGTRHLAPVIGFATRRAWRVAAARAWARALTPAVDRWAQLVGAPPRVALHPADLREPMIMAAAERAIRALATRWPAVTTRAALATAPR